MPVIYKLLVNRFYKYFFLAITCSLMGAFIMRLSKLSSLLVFTPSIFTFFKFFLQYMHQLTPFTIAVACFIANLSSLKELFKSSLIQGLYVSGLSYKEIITPLVINSLLWFLLTLYSTCEISPIIQLKLNEKLLRKTVFNPLLALQSNAVFHKTPYLLLGQTQKNNTFIKDFCLLITPLTNSAPLAISADKSYCHNDTLCLTNMQLIIPDSALLSNCHQFATSHNYQHLQIPIESMTKIIAKKTSTELIKCLPFHLLLESSSMKSIREITYRLSLSLISLSLSLLVFIHFRNPCMKASVKTTGLCLFLFISFLTSRGLTQDLFAISLYLLPHLVIFFSFFHSILSRGRIENAL